ncbi:cyclophilin-like fold protein [Vibrio natriegens]|uniref:cyclophilin-like fold protein n=1 Tax=Vibrio natriegens TaxID=691 RepID=UPI0035581333
MIIASIVPNNRHRNTTVERSPLRGVQIMRVLGFLCGLVIFGSCDAANPDSPTVMIETIIQPEETRMWMTVGERRFAITLANSEAARVFTAMLPLSIDMADLHNNEKYAELPSALPTSASRPGTIRKGDLMLYGSKTLVIFYMTFSSSYSYTRIGYVDDPDELSKALGRRSVRVMFSKD